MNVYKIIIFTAIVVGSFLIGRHTSKEVIKETITVKELPTVELKFEQPSPVRLYWPEVIVLPGEVVDSLGSVDTAKLYADYTVVRDYEFTNKDSSAIDTIRLNLQFNRIKSFNWYHTPIRYEKVSIIEEKRPLRPYIGGSVWLNGQFAIDGGLLYKNNMFGVTLNSDKSFGAKYAYIF